MHKIYVKDADGNETEFKMELDSLDFMYLHRRFPDSVVKIWNIPRSDEVNLQTFQVSSENNIEASIDVIPDKEIKDKTEKIDANTTNDSLSNIQKNQVSKYDNQKPKEKDNVKRTDRPKDGNNIINKSELRKEDEIGKIEEFHAGKVRDKDETDTKVLSKLKEKNKIVNTKEIKQRVKDKEIVTTEADKVVYTKESKLSRTNESIQSESEVQNKRMEVNKNDCFEMDTKNILNGFECHLEDAQTNAKNNKRITEILNDPKQLEKLNKYERKKLILEGIIRTELVRVKLARDGNNNQSTNVNQFEELHSFEKRNAKVLNVDKHLEECVLFSWRLIHIINDDITISKEPKGRRTEIIEFLKSLKVDEDKLHAVVVKIDKLLESKHRKLFSNKTAGKITGKAKDTEKIRKENSNCHVDIQKEDDEKTKSEDTNVEDQPYEVIFKYCHICRVKLPAVFVAVHEKSVSHQCMVRINMECQHRMYQHTAGLQLPRKEIKEVFSTRLENCFFCTVCNEAINVVYLENHMESEKHKQCVNIEFTCKEFLINLNLQSYAFKEDYENNSTDNMVKKDEKVKSSELVNPTTNSTKTTQVTKKIKSILKKTKLPSEREFNKILVPVNSKLINSVENTNQCHTSLDNVNQIKKSGQENQLKNNLVKDKNKAEQSVKASNGPHANQPHSSLVNEDQINNSDQENELKNINVNNPVTDKNKTKIRVKVSNGQHASQLHSSLVNEDQINNSDQENELKNINVNNPVTDKNKTKIRVKVSNGQHASQLHSSLVNEDQINNSDQENELKNINVNNPVTDKNKTEISVNILNGQHVRQLNSALHNENQILRGKIEKCKGKIEEYKEKITEVLPTLIKIMKTNEIVPYTISNDPSVNEKRITGSASINSTENKESDIACNLDDEELPKTDKEINREKEEAIIEQFRILCNQIEQEDKIANEIIIPCTLGDNYDSDASIPEYENNVYSKSNEINLTSNRWCLKNRTQYNQLQCGSFLNNYVHSNSVQEPVSQDPGLSKTIECKTKEDNDPTTTSIKCNNLNQDTETNIESSPSKVDQSQQTENDTSINVIKKYNAKEIKNSLDVSTSKYSESLKIEKNTFKTKENTTTDKVVGENITKSKSNANVPLRKYNVPRTSSSSFVSDDVTTTTIEAKSNTKDNDDKISITSKKKDQITKDKQEEKNLKIESKLPQEKEISGHQSYKQNTVSREGAITNKQVNVLYDSFNTSGNFSGLVNKIDEKRVKDGMTHTGPYDSGSKRMSDRIDNIVICSSNKDDTNINQNQTFPTNQINLIDKGSSSETVHDILNNNVKTSINAVNKNIGQLNRAFPTIQANPTNNKFCEVCEVVVPNSLISQHFTSRRHKLIEEIVNVGKRAIQNPDFHEINDHIRANGITKDIKCNLKVPDKNIGTQLTKQVYNNKNKDNINTYLCDICQIYISNNDSNISGHLLGRRHKKNEKNKKESMKVGVVLNNNVAVGLNENTSHEAYEKKISKVGETLKNSDRKENNLQPTKQLNINTGDNEYFCSVCQVNVPNRHSNISEHNLGRVHKSNEIKVNKGQSITTDKIELNSYENDKLKSSMKSLENTGIESKAIKFTVLNESRESSSVYELKDNIGGLKEANKIDTQINATANNLNLSINNINTKCKTTNTILPNKSDVFNKTITDKDNQLKNIGVNNSVTEFNKEAEIVRLPVMGNGLHANDKINKSMSEGISDRTNENKIVLDNEIKVVNKITHTLASRDAIRTKLMEKNLSQELPLKNTNDINKNQFFCKICEIYIPNTNTDVSEHYLGVKHMINEKRNINIQ